MSISDEEALRLGRELAELAIADQAYVEEDFSTETLISLARIALKLCRPIVLEELREPTEAMMEAGLEQWSNLRDIWQAMIDAA